MLALLLLLGVARPDNAARLRRGADGQPVARDGGVLTSFDCTPAQAALRPDTSRSTWERYLPGTEPVANALLGTLVLEGLVPDGGVLDVGAYNGEFAVYYAHLMPDRKIFAIDPSMTLVQRTHQKSVPNLCTLWGAVGARDEPPAMRGPPPVNDESYHYVDEGARAFPVHAIDTLFARTRMGFLHLDVEGSELGALQGATRLLRRDQPLISYELTVHDNQRASRELLAYTEALGYASFLVEEIAGMRADVRNVLAIPHSRLKLVQFRSSPGLNAAFLGNLLLPVDSRNILLHSFPCCAPGAVCCPYDRGQRQLSPGCCSHWRVDEWLKSTVQSGGADLQWFSRRRWYDQRNVKFGSPQEKLFYLWRMRRPLNESGLSNNHLYMPGTQNFGATGRLRSRHAQERR